MQNTAAQKPSMFRSSFRRAEFALAGFAKRNPTLWSISWEICARVDFLLPHDRSYLGFAHFAVPGGLFLDIGANNGITALGIHKVLPGYRIFSVEADTSHRPALERARRRIPQFEYRMIGAGDVAKDLVLYTPRLDGWPIHALTSSDLDYLKISVARDFGARRALRARYDQRTATCMPLDQLGLSPDVIKIDVEGSELPALTGLSATIDRQRPVIMVEFTPGFFDRTAQFLDAKGYESFIYDDSRNVFRSFEYDRDSHAWSHAAAQINVFSVPREKTVRIADRVASRNGAVAPAFHERRAAQPAAG